MDFLSEQPTTTQSSLLVDYSWSSTCKKFQSSSRSNKQVMSGNVNTLTNQLSTMHINYQQFNMLPYIYIIDETGIFVLWLPLEQTDLLEIFTYSYRVSW